MLIDERALRHWMENFYGYGSWDAKFWFIAHEEGGGDLPEEVAEKVNYFQSVHRQSENPALCDIRDLYQQVAVHFEGKAEMFANHYEFRFGKESIAHSVWKNLISFRYGYQKQPLPDLITYQRESFLRSRSEALIRLYPLPSPHSHAWFYSWLDMPQLPFLKSRERYENFFYDVRVHTILKQISNCKPEVVLMYGMKNISRLKQSFLNSFERLSFRQIKAIKMQIPQHHIAAWNGTKIIITTQIPALRHQRIETGFEWEKFGDAVRDYKS